MNILTKKYMCDANEISEVLKNYAVAIFEYIMVCIQQIITAFSVECSVYILRHYIKNPNYHLAVVGITHLINNCEYLRNVEILPFYGLF